MERDNNKMITQELQSAVKTIKAAILQSQVPELPEYQADASLL